MPKYNKKIRLREFNRQHNLQQCWSQINTLLEQTNTFINKSSLYQKTGFSWEMYINQLFGSIKQILKTNNIKLRSTPYRITQNHFYNLKKLSTTNEIINELKQFICVIKIKSRCV